MIATHLYIVQINRKSTKEIQHILAFWKAALLKKLSIFTWLPRVVSHQLKNEKVYVYEIVFCESDFSLTRPTPARSLKNRPIPIDLEKSVWKNAHIKKFSVETSYKNKYYLKRQTFFNKTKEITINFFKNWIEKWLLRNQRSPPCGVQVKVLVMSQGLNKNVLTET